MLGEVKVSSNADGTISADEVKDFSGEPKKFQEIAPLMYRSIGGQDRMAFKRDASGRLFFAIDWPFMTFQRVGGLQSRPLNYFVLGAGVLVLLLTVILWPIAALVRRHYGRKLILNSGVRRLRIAVRLVCLADLIFLGALTVLLSSLDDPGAINSHGHLLLWIHLLQIIGLIGAVGALVAIYSAARQWGAASSSSQATAVGATSRDSGQETVTAGAHSASQPGWIWGKVFAVLTALACIGLAWFFIYWNLLNFNLNF